MNDFYMSFTLPFVTDSGNKLLRTHWAIRRRIKQGYLKEMLYTLPKVEKKKEKRRIHFISYRKRRLDDDNLIAGFKDLRDCLIRLGFIYDDSPTYLGATYEQQLDSKNPRTVIIIKGEKK